MDGERVQRAERIGGARRTWAAGWFLARRARGAVLAPARPRSAATLLGLLLLGLAWCASCATTSSASDPTKDAAVAAQLDALEVALRDGDDGAARNAARKLRELGAGERELAYAAEAERLVAARVEPRLQPSLEALRVALRSGDDEVARSILRRMRLMSPTGSALELVEAFERIVDGRTAVSGLDLRAECAWMPGPTAGRGGTCSLRFAASARDGVPRTLEPGPATLMLTAITVDRRGHLSAASEARSFDDLARLDVPAEGGASVELARVPLELPPGALALRLTALIELRAGSVHQHGRALPAMNAGVTAGELVLLDGRLLALGPAARDELARRASETSARPADLLDIALRVRREDREAVLDSLAERAIDPARAELLAPALRWLAPDVRGGADPGAWGDWLAERAGRLRDERSRGEPVLPRRPQPRLAGP